MQQPSEMACYWTKIPMAGDRLFSAFRNTNFSWYASNEGEREQWIDIVSLLSFQIERDFSWWSPFPVLIWIHGPAANRTLTLRHGFPILSHQRQESHVIPHLYQIHADKILQPQLYIYKLTSWQCHLSSSNCAQWRSNFPLVSPCCAVSLGCVEGSDVEAMTRLPNLNHVLSQGVVTIHGYLWINALLCNILQS